MQARVPGEEGDLEEPLLDDGENRLNPQPAEQVGENDLILAGSKRQQQELLVSCPPAEEMLRLHVVVLRAAQHALDRSAHNLLTASSVRDLLHSECPAALIQSQQRHCVSFTCRQLQAPAQQLLSAINKGS